MTVAKPSRTRPSNRQIVEETLDLCCEALRHRTTDWKRVAALLEKRALRCRELARRGGNDDDDGARRFELEALPSKIVHDWYRLPRFVDQRGTPLPLKLWGKAPSVEAIARLRTESPADVRRWIEVLLELGALRKVRGGKYLPANYTMMLAASKQAMRRHGWKMLDALVSALTHNFLEQDAAAREFERSVHSARLRSDEIPAFRRFLAAQGAMFIEAVDCWLEERQARAGNESAAPSSEVIVGLYSNVTPNPTASRNKPRRAARGKSARQGLAGARP